ncbi:MAG: hypothetical protein KGV57_04390 [Fusobacterium sp.]|nr:hypothetical protein [Fusobacterium sp.]
MLLKSSIFILLVLNIFFSDLKILIPIFIVILSLNLVFNKNKKKYVKRLGILLFFYLSTFIIQLFYAQEGKVLYKIYNFYITEQGLINFSVNFMRIINLVLLSWLINEINIFKGRFKEYQKIINTVIDLVPQVFVVFKKKMKLKYFYRYIIKEIETKNI